MAPCSTKSASQSSSSTLLRDIRSIDVRQSFKSRSDERTAGTISSQIGVTAYPIRDTFCPGSVISG
jgi:hypothetical protein